MLHFRRQGGDVRLQKVCMELARGRHTESLDAAAREGNQLVLSAGPEGKPEMFLCTEKMNVMTPELLP